MARTSERPVLRGPTCTISVQLRPGALCNLIFQEQSYLDHGCVGRGEQDAVGLCVGQVHNTVGNGRDTIGPSELYWLSHLAESLFGESAAEHRPCLRAQGDGTGEDVNTIPHTREVSPLPILLAVYGGVLHV